MNALKLFVITLISSLIAYMEPINNSAIVLCIVFIWDIIIWGFVDLVINKDRVRIKKILLALVFVSLYTRIVASVFVIDRLMNDEEESLKIVKTLTYVCIYFYTSNILVNLTILFPSNKVFSFLYELLGLRIMKRLPELAHLFNFEHKKTKDHE